MNTSRKVVETRVTALVSQQMSPQALLEQGGPIEKIFQIISSEPFRGMPNELASTEAGQQMLGDLATVIEQVTTFPARQVITENPHPSIERFREYLRLLSSSDDPEWRALADFMLGMSIMELTRYLKTRDELLTPKAPPSLPLRQQAINKAVSKELTQKAAFEWLQEQLVYEQVRNEELPPEKAKATIKALINKKIGLDAFTKAIRRETRKRTKDGQDEQKMSP